MWTARADARIYYCSIIFVYVEMHLMCDEQKRFSLLHFGTHAFAGSMACNCLYGIIQSIFGRVANVLRIGCRRVLINAACLAIFRRFY